MERLGWCFALACLAASCGDDDGAGADAGPSETDAGPIDAGMEPPPVSIRLPRALSAGSDHTCVVAAGRVQCWGGNAAGQLGDGTTANRATPAAVAGLDDVLEVSAGDRVTCAVRRAGTVACWGTNEAGQLGDGTTTARAGVADVPGIDDAVRVDAGDDLVCVIRRAGSVSCWGTFAFSVEPSAPRAAPIGAAHDVSAGYHGCLASGARAYCWGNGGEGELGTGELGTTVSFEAGTTPAGTVLVSEVAAGWGFTCARGLDGQAWCWGSGIDGVLGDGSTTRRPQPVQVSGLVDAVHVSAGGRNPAGLIGHACAVRATGAVVCWGLNGSGQLGDGTMTNRSTPVAVVGIDDAIDVSAGGSHSCAIDAAGQVRCWGNNFVGQLGDGTMMSRATPVDVR